MSDERLFPKSGSVWYEEVDTALFSILNSRISVTNADGIVVPMKVLMKNAEEEIKEFPCISIYHYDEKFSHLRDGRDTFVIATDITSGTITKESPAKPYDLYYQIELWSEYQIDINTMTRQFIALLGEHYPLNVLDTEGNPRICAMDKVDYKPLDYVDDDLKKNICRRVYSYRIQVELDETPPSIEPYASDINIKF